MNQVVSPNIMKRRTATALISGNSNSPSTQSVCCYCNCSHKPVNCEAVVQAEARKQILTLFCMPEKRSSQSGVQVNRQVQNLRWSPPFKYLWNFNCKCNFLPASHAIKAHCLRLHRATQQCSLHHQHPLHSMWTPVKQCYCRQQQLKSTIPLIPHQH